MVVSLLGGCSNLYQDTVDFFSGEDSNAAPPEAPRIARPASDPDKPFPSLSSVPSGLSADLQGRKYATASVQRQGPPKQHLEAESASAPPAAPTPTADKPFEQSATAAGAVAPAPPTAPKVAVASAPIGAKAPPIPAPKASVPAMKHRNMVPGLADFSPGPRGVGVRETFMARLNQRLPLITPEPTPQAVQPQTAQPEGGGSLQPYLPRTPESGGGVPFSYDSPSFDTVFITSSGVVQGAGTGSFNPIGALGGAGGGVGGPFIAFPAADQLAISPIGSPAISAMSPDAVRVATILFKNGSAKLDRGDRRVLKKVRNIYRQQGGRLRVVGHSSSRTRNLDPVRHKMVNYRISADRANVVIAALKRLGVSSSDIVADAKSDAMPLYFEYMPSGEAGNRRAEIYFE